MIVFLVELFFFIVPTEVAVSPKSTQVIKGSSVTLFCNATGDPKPSLKWTKNNKPTVLFESSNLTLPNVDRPGNPSDTTQYHCTASNGYGDPMFKTDTATVTVICEYYSYYSIISLCNQTSLLSLMCLLWLYDYITFICLLCLCLYIYLLAKLLTTKILFV